LFLFILFPLLTSHSSRLKALSESYSVKAAQKWDPKLKISSSILSQWIPDGITVNGRPKATGILDTINACIAHGIEVPSELMDVNMMRDVEAAAVAEWFEGYLGIPSESPIPVLPFSYPAYYFVLI
jgi:hypothetical protein